MKHQVLARKWRPQSFDAVVGQPYVVQALSNALNRKYLHHAYLFTGTRGVGKTTLGRIIAKCLNCEAGISATPCDKCSFCNEIDAGRFPDLFEVDAASRTKVEDTRELLDNVQYTPTKGRFKVYLIDEVHMLSGHSFNALLKTLEEPPPHVKFILATTDHQKLPATVLSRCLQFHLSQMQPLEIATHCQYILNQEHILFEKPATELLARAANGSMRDALSLLDQSIAYGNGKVNTADVKAMLGTIEPTVLFDLLDALHRKNGNELLAGVHILQQQGSNFSHALADLLSLLHQIAIIQAVPDAPLENPQPRLLQLAKQLGCEDVQLFYQIGLIGQRDLPYAPTAQSGFEMTLLRMLAFYPQNASQLTLETPATTQPQTAAVTTAKPATNVKTPWHTLLPQLKLTGMALALARQCSLKRLTDTDAELLLQPKQEALVQKKYVERINNALNQHLQRDIKLTITVDKHDGETPAGIAIKQAQNKQMRAEQAIMNDQQVQRLVQTFDATIVKDSIMPIEEGSPIANGEKETSGDSI